MDRLDKRILTELQRQANLPMQELGDRVGLSQAPCWRRIKRLEEAGFIRGRVALLDPGRLDLAVNVFVELKLAHPADRPKLATAVQAFPEIVECYLVSGETDFVLRLVAPDVPAYQRLLQRLLEQLPEICNVKSTFALSEIKYTTALPIS